MDLFVDLDRRGPTGRPGAAQQLFEQIRDAIESGRLAPGDRLPPSRQVAADLGVSRHTVTTAYSRLTAEGYTAGAAGAGSSVTGLRSPHEQPTGPSTAGGTAADRTRAGRSAGGRAAGGPAAPPERTRSERTRSVPREVAAELHELPITHDLRLGAPDPDLFPVADWRRAVSSGLHLPPPGYGSPLGDIDLRRAIAHWIGRSRFVVTDADRVAITSGAQQAIDLVGRLLLTAGDRVAVEDPGYPPVRHALANIGAEIVPVPVDHEGIVVDRIPVDVRLVVVTPSHQFPFGVTMSMARRRALLHLAERLDITVVEDDYDSEYRHVDRPLEPLHRLDRADRVVYVGTFSKTLSPSLRLGFAVVPFDLVDALAGLRESVDWQPPALLQHALHRVLVDGTFDRHLRRTRRIYHERHRLVDAFVRAQTDCLVPVTSNAGLHVAALLTDSGAAPSPAVTAEVRPDVEHVRRARRAGVAIEALSAYGIADPRQQGLLIGFGSVSTAALSSALTILTEVLTARPDRSRSK